MTNRAGDANWSASRKEPYNLGAPDRWNDPVFRDFVLEGIRRDGFGKNEIALVRDVFTNRPVASAAEFITLLEERAGGSPKARNLVEHLGNLVFWNTKEGRRDRSAGRPVDVWPNNPSVKANSPEYYVNIFDDFFYRDEHRFITRATPIGSAGSCFAMRIAHQLQAWGYNYVIEEDDLPPNLPVTALPSTNFRIAPARIGALYTLPSMRQMVERAFGLWSPESVYETGSDGRIQNPFRRVDSSFEDINAYVRDQVAHVAALRRALMKCDVFILTLGLTEAWYYGHSNDYTVIGPPMTADPLLRRRKHLTVEDNVQELERIFDVYIKHKPDIKFIVSVSPVHLYRTFSETDHVVAASNYSKSKLVIAAHLFVERHPEQAFYFPAFETVVYGTRNPWESDMRHVSPEGVRRVMGLFQKMFLVEQDPLPVLHWRENRAPVLNKKRLSERGIRFVKALLPASVLKILRPMKARLGNRR